VAATLRANSNVIKAWAVGAGPGQTKVFSYTSATVVGQGVVRSTGQLTQMKSAVVVLRKVITGNRVYFVLTAYPKP
jgi:predicted transcriptional regulator